MPYPVSARCGNGSNGAKQKRCNFAHDIQDLYEPFVTGQVVKSLTQSIPATSEKRTVSTPYFLTNTTFSCKGNVERY